MKRIATGILVSAFALVGLAAPAHAAAQVRSINAVAVDAKPIPSPTPVPLCRSFEVTDDNPFHAAGTGRMAARGKGHAHFNIKKGGVFLSGRGVVAVRASDNDQVRVAGFGHKLEIGDWVIYWGHGKMQVKGDDFSMVMFGRLQLRAWGTGEVDMTGSWHGKICRLRRLTPRPIPAVDVLPQDLKAQFVD